MSLDETASSSNTPRASLPAWARWTILGVLILLVLLPLASAGLWEPPELRGAEFGRRVAVNLFGAEQLLIEGAENGIPTVEEVGRGELPFLAAGLGFKLFGLHDWAGRLPLCLSALLGALAVYFACRRLASQKVALLTLAVLSTAPLFFVQARAILGDAMTMACSALAFSALALACFDVKSAGWLRGVYFGFALLAMTGGIYSRGVLIGAAVPALSVGLAWALAGSAQRWEARTFLGVTTLLLGVSAAIWGSVAWLRATPDDYYIALGTVVDPPKQFATHDFLILHLGHAFFPWSAFLPVAIGFTLGRPSNSESEAGRAELGLRTALLLCAGLAIGAHTLLAPTVGLVPFSAVYALAAIAAFGLLEWDKKPAGAPAAALVVAALAIVLFADFRHFPDKAMSPFAVDKASLPEAFEQTTKWSFALVTVPIVLSAALLAIERWPWVRGVFGSAMRVTRKNFRSLLLATGAALAGIALSVGYYPALAAQVSPVGAFETFEELRTPGEPLATTGKGGNASAYYGSLEQHHFERDRDALKWLREGGDQRRWLIVKGSDLAKLNSDFRQASGGKNLPVLGQSSGQVLLVSDRLKPGEKDKNPLQRFLPEKRPEPARPVRATFDDDLRVLGWEISDPKTGEVLSALKRGGSYRIHIYYEVLGRISRNWKTFVHIDGASSRVNADHDTLDDQYAFRHWNRGDFIADDYIFDLEPDVVPGEYTVYFGLYSGKTRFDVTEGGDKDDRVDGGLITIR